MAQQQNKPAAPVKTSTPLVKPGASASTSKGPDTHSLHFIFDKGNYRLFIIAIAIVAFGFVLMSGTTDIYSTTKIVIAPLVVLGGFTVGFFAIFKKPEAKS
jgi:type IV secretory pathway VirB2 component (pilin)